MPPNVRTNGFPLLLSLSFSSSSFLFIRFLVSTADQLRRLMIGAFGPFNGGGGIAL